MGLLITADEWLPTIEIDWGPCLPLSDDRRLNQAVGFGVLGWFFCARQSRA